MNNLQLFVNRFSFEGTQVFQFPHKKRGPVAGIGVDYVPESFFEDRPGNAFRELYIKTFPSFINQFFGKMDAKRLKLAGDVLVGHGVEFF